MIPAKNRICLLKVLIWRFDVGEKGRRVVLDRKRRSTGIIASGRNEIARRMLEIAETCGIKTVSDPFLADIMYSSEIGTCIPEETWGAVASIFAFFGKKAFKKDGFTQKS